MIEQYGLGDNQILVELPGVTDLSRVENIIQSTAKLEIHAVVPGRALAGPAAGAGGAGRSGASG